MKKSLVLSLSIVITASSLLMTACGSKNDTVSAMNNVSTEIESIAESSTEIESTTEIETETQDETKKQDETETQSTENVSVDSTSTTGHFADGEERGEDADNFETENPTQQETSETQPEIKTTKYLGFTIDELSLDPSKSDLFDNVDDMEDYLQLCIEAYEKGDFDYYTLMGSLANVGVSDSTIDKFIEQYKKTQPSSSSSSSSTTSSSTVMSDGYGTPEEPEETIPAKPLHPEWSDIRVVP